MVVFAIPLMALASGAWAEAAFYAGGVFITSLALGDNVGKAVARHQRDKDATDAVNPTPPNATDAVDPRAPNATDAVSLRAPNATDAVNPRRPRPRR
jgi:hypothetical protein